MNVYDAMTAITVALLALLTPLVAVAAKRLGKVEKSVNGHATHQREMIQQLRAEIKTLKEIRRI